MPSPSTAECSGRHVLALVTALGPFRVRGLQILAAHGVAEVRPDGWYPLPTVARALDEIGARMGEPALFAIGGRIGAAWARAVDTHDFAAACAGYVAAFASEHRGLAADGARVTITGPESADARSCTPYPCEVLRGTIHGFLRARFGRVVVSEHPAHEPCAEGAGCSHRVRLGGVEDAR